MEPNRKIQLEKEKLEHYLLGRGLKISAGRNRVFAAVMHAHGHFTAEDLVKRFKKTPAKVSRATIYRNLKEMLEVGIIRETAFGDKHHHFEHIYDEKKHHHAHCIRCHAFIEFPDLDEDKIYNQFLESQKFKILGHEMHFYGICKQCQTHEN